MSDERQPFTIRLKPELHDQVIKLAEADERPVNYIINKLVEKALSHD